MQSLYGKFRLVAKQTINSLKNIELSKVASVESRYSGCSMNRCLGFNSERSSFLLNKQFGAKVVKPASSESCSIASMLPSYRVLSSGSQSASSAFKFPTRNFSTSGSTPENVSAAFELPPRIKFKRLDKTARHIMQIIDKEVVEEVKSSREIPEIKPGYIIQLKVVVPENKRRVSIIKGIVIAMYNAGLNTTFRIRRLVGGVGIENLFPLYSPNIKEITVLDKKRVRRAKLYYLRDRMNPLRKN
ncbi:50S ribosomal protein L19-1, chloroplastic-like isoform X1 [Salvia miltiorrhiza]|uniref:50S ribosomal protein L19-1, chloroplastic-like isoform X1 n=2 Tax=Salvia miltiorrhiza TaxID=226208 RepID=UPI0025ACC82B|nr:50S ribosomal protein L19-1, chloroplastic-like isoform X1 [Salvia miltiorrhiza]